MTCSAAKAKAPKNIIPPSNPARMAPSQHGLLGEAFLAPVRFVDSDGGKSMAYAGKGQR
jgi:hypothetical protein